jgi:hypothetical protein
MKPLRDLVPRAVGFSAYIRTAEPEHAPGSCHLGSGGYLWVYVQATAAIAGATCAVTYTPPTVDTAGEVITEATCTAGAGATYASLKAFLAQEWGWVRKVATLI